MSKKRFEATWKELTAATDLAITIPISDIEDIDEAEEEEDEQSEEDASESTHRLLTKLLKFQDKLLCSIMIRRLIQMNL